MNRLIVFLGMLLLVSAPAWGTGRPCPTDRGACFIDLPQGPGFAIFTEEEFLQFSIDGLHDFVRWNLTEEGFVHIAESEAEIVYCPFPLWEPNPDPDLCVVGRGHVSMTGRPADFFGLCPGQADRGAADRGASHFSKRQPAYPRGAASASSSSVFHLSRSPDAIAA
jgi:hypothetical protein